jgi:hypothetical protein
MLLDTIINFFSLMCFSIFLVGMGVIFYLGKCFNDWWKSID